MQGRDNTLPVFVEVVQCNSILQPEANTAMHMCMHTHSPSAHVLSAICVTQRCDPGNPAALTAQFHLCTMHEYGQCV